MTVERRPRDTAERYGRETRQPRPRAKLTRAMAPDTISAARSTRASSALQLARQLRAAAEMSSAGDAAVRSAAFSTAVPRSSAPRGDAGQHAVRPVGGGRKTLTRGARAHAHARGAVGVLRLAAARARVRVPRGRIFWPCARRRRPWRAGGSVSSPEHEVELPDVQSGATCQTCVTERETSLQPRQRAQQGHSRAPRTFAVTKDELLVDPDGFAGRKTVQADLPEKVESRMPAPTASRPQTQTVVTSLSSCGAQT